MECYFAQNQTKNKELILDQEDTKHITKVLRHKINDEIIVIFNQQKYLTKIIKLEPSIFCQIISSLPNSDSELNVKVTLVMALLKGDKFDLVVQKAVELGVYQIIPIQLERCVSVLDSEEKKKKKVLRWQSIAKAAAKQSNRNIIPLIQPIISRIEDLNAYKSDVNFLAYEKQVVKEDWADKSKNNNTITIVIGPEGGLSEKEVEKFLSLNFIAISLGSLILRAETAPLYLLSIINYYSTMKKEH